MARSRILLYVRASVIADMRANDGGNYFRLCVQPFNSVYTIALFSASVVSICLNFCGKDQTAYRV